MTNSELFELLTSKSGGFSLPVLITLTDGKTELNYVNARNNIVFNGRTYKAEVFQFSANADVLGFFWRRNFRNCADDRCGFSSGAKRHNHNKNKRPAL